MANYALKPLLLPQEFIDLHNTLQGLQSEILQPIEDGAPKRATFDAYTVTNLTTSRTFDADTVTLAELADIVGTLIEDLNTP